jgi:hypothetical protein
MDPAQSMIIMHAHHYKCKCGLIFKSHQCVSRLVAWRVVTGDLQLQPSRRKLLWVKWFPCDLHPIERVCQQSIETDCAIPEMRIKFNTFNYRTQSGLWRASIILNAESQVNNLIFTSHLLPTAQGRTRGQWAMIEASRTQRAGR